MTKFRLVIVGGVAGGASAATRARRLSEEAEITIFERGPYVSFANCGLPYYVGDEIAERKNLVLQSPESFKARYNISVRVNSEVIAIDRVNKKVRVKNLLNNTEYEQLYDALILAPGAKPLKPPLPGIDRPGHFALRDIPDAEQIKKWISEPDVKSAVIVGAGFIGLEMAEQLNRRGLKVTIIEAMPQVMLSLDPEMSAIILNELNINGVKVILSNPVKGFEEPTKDEPAKASIVVLENGERVPADLVLLCMGVKPETTLARAAGLEVGESGGIRVNKHLQSSDPNIWAVGDAIEVRHAVTGRWCLIPLAGPANRQGRIAADNIFGIKSEFDGVLGTNIVRVFNVVAGSTGANERELQKAKMEYLSVHLHPGSHAGYYPGATPVSIKLLFSPENGKVLGAQVVGSDGVDKRIDVFATALKAGMTVDDIAELELAYAPPFGSAKDPVNLAGMAAQNILRGLVKPAYWNEIEKLKAQGAVILDVRTPAERSNGFIPGSIHIPLDQLRERLTELPKDKEIVVSCQSGQRSYFACRILSQRGFKVRNFSGSYKTYKAVYG